MLRHQLKNSLAIQYALTPLAITETGSFIDMQLELSIMLSYEPSLRTERE